MGRVLLLDRQRLELVKVVAYLRRIVGVAKTLQRDHAPNDWREYRSQAIAVSETRRHPALRGFQPEFSQWRESSRLEPFERRIRLPKKSLPRKPAVLLTQPRALQLRPLFRLANEELAYAVLRQDFLLRPMRPHD